jgi:predicted dehydrogenase
MNTVKVAVVGIGNMGTFHARALLDGKVSGAELVAICDINPERFTQFPKVKTFADHQSLLRSGIAEAVIIATPHYDHTVIGIAALKAGLHVLVEKPISVHRADCESLIAAHTNKKQVFAAMFNQRTDPYYRKLRELVQSGELGVIRRVNWIITNWFRTEAYYASGSWRATWGGEGGGVLLNQCPHNLDLYQWMFGMPNRVRAFCQFGRYHNIEVEDDVTAYYEYDNGATGVFITSTGEAPGTNRLEVTAERGRVVLENDRFLYRRNEMPMTEFSRTTTQGFSAPETWEIEIPVRGHGGQHMEILNNFSAAITEGAPLIAPAPEGIHSVELANAMLLSTWQKATVDLPIDGALYSRELKARVAGSKRFKPVSTPSAPAADFSSSFGR